MAGPLLPQLPLCRPVNVVRHAPSYPQLAIAFFGAVLAVALLISDGEGNWMKGALLLVAFGVISALVVFMQDPSIGKIDGNAFGVSIGAPPITTAVGGGLDAAPLPSAA